MTIKILSDSACDLSNQITKEYDIDILPIVLIKDNEEYLDQVDINKKDVYDDMKNGKIYRTSQIPLNIFIEKFKYYAKRKKNVIYIGFSSGLSGTLDTSIMAKNIVMDEYPGFNLEIVDSKAACSGFGIMVYKAAIMAKNGEDKKDILNMLDFYQSHMEHIFTVDNIEYLFRGGRVTRTEALICGMLSIKPVLNVEDGKLVAIKKIRGKNKVIKTMLNIMIDRCSEENFKNQIIGISHGDDLESALKLKETLFEKFEINNFLISEIGGAVGSHSGPGTLGVTFLNKKY